MRGAPVSPKAQQVALVPGEQDIGTAGLGHRQQVVVAWIR